jgi:hypothetical protein
MQGGGLLQHNMVGVVLKKDGTHVRKHIKKKNRWGPQVGETGNKFDFMLLVYYRT